MLIAHGAAAKVPVLVTDDGVGLCESLVIAHYADRLSGGKLYPSDPAQVAKTLEVEGIASALMDSLFVRSRENRREAGEKSPGVIELEADRSRRCYENLTR